MNCTLEQQQIVMNYLKAQNSKEVAIKKLVNSGMDADRAKQIIDRSDAIIKHLA